jgi:hypothetical protein
MEKMILAALLIVLLHGCTIPTSAPTPTATATLLPPTATNSPTPVPHTPTATPIPPLSDEGPWLVHYLQVEPGIHKYEVVITNLDGSGYQRLTLPDLFEWLAISPPDSINGPHAAIRITNPQLEFGEQVLKTIIWILSLPDGRVIRKVPLVGEQAQTWLEETSPDYTIGLTSTVLEAPYQWSPDGHYLAFSGALDGESTDLYIYDVIEDQITQLTDGSKQAVIHSWSPDSKWIIHESVLFYNDPSRVVYATWAASIDGEVVRLEYGPFNQHPIIGWLSEETFLTYTERSQGSNKELRTVNLATGKTEFIYDHPFFEAAYDPSSDTILLNLQPVDFASAESLPGIYRLDPETGEIEILISGSFSDLTWLSQIERFRTLENENSLTFFNSEGILLCSIAGRQEENLILAPNQKWYLVSGIAGFTMYNQRCEAVFEIKLGAGRILWLPDSSSFYLYLEGNRASYPVLQIPVESGREPEMANPNASLSGYDQVIYP